MSTANLIRRLHFRDNLSIREISRRTGYSRVTVRKWLTGDAGRIPKYKFRQPVSTKLAPFADQLREWVKADEFRLRKNRRTARLMCDELSALGYTGAYTQVAIFVAALRKQNAKKTKAYIPMSFQPGDAMQFDWSTEESRIGGKLQKIQVAHTKLCYSRAYTLSTYPQQTHEMLFDAHARAFALFGGAPKRGIYDNMSTAVDQVLTGKDRCVNKRFQAMCAHYALEATFCNRAAGWEKGIVEKNVQDRRKQIFHAIRERNWNSFEELNDFLAAEYQRRWLNTRHPEQRARTIAEVLEEERPTLFSPKHGFDGYVEVMTRVSPTSLVTHATHHYSVPCEYVHQMVSLRIHAFELIAAVGDVILARHVRFHTPTKGHTRYEWQHYLPLLERKPGALRDGAPFQQLPKPLLRLTQILVRQPHGDRLMVEVLSAVPRVGLKAVCHVAERILKQGYPTMEQIREQLRQLTDLEPVPVDTRLTSPTRLPAIANVDRYETLQMMPSSRQPTIEEPS